jgi:uncharacterized protein YjdB
MTFKHKLSRRLALMHVPALAAVLAAAACENNPLEAPPAMDQIPATSLVTSNTFIGDRVQATHKAYIRSGPSVTATLLGTQPVGAQGTIIDGPVVDSAGDGLTRWNIDFDSGVDGWGAHPYFDKIGSGTVASVTVTPSADTVTVGATVQLTATVTDSVGHILMGHVVVWSSGDSSVAAVSTSGLVTGRAAGVATITAAAGGKDATASVTVLAPKFVPGDRVQTTGNANIRSGPSGSATLVGKQPAGAVGTILGGPVWDTAGDGLERWEIDFDAGPDGWAAEPYAGLVKLEPPPPAPVASVDVTPAADTLTVGSTVQFTAVARDAEGNVLSDRAMSWLSRDTAIAAVTAAGLVTGITTGAVYVTATSEGQADSALVTVVPVPVASVRVSPATASVAAGSTVQLAATTLDAAGNLLTGRAVTWSTSEAAIATVSSSGLVTAVAAGTATISATSEGRSGTATVTTTVRPGYYVAPHGSSSGSGTPSSPWSLAYALGSAGGRIQPGDTVWLRGGTYRGAPFRSTLTGTATRPIVVRQYPGERAIVDGAGATSDNFVVAGAYAWFWGFELMNSDPTRTTSSTANDVRKNLLVNNASHTKYMNLVLRDGGVAFYNYPSQVDVEIVGCIIYNNGWQGPDRGHGHALYLKSYNGPVIVRDNVLFNQFGYGVHAYTNAGSGQLNNMWFEGNVAFNNGTLSTNSTSSNILLGGADYATGDVFQGNVAYFSPGLSGTNVRIGYGTLQNGTVQLLQNYAVGGSLVLDMGYWTSATVTGNSFISSASVVRLNDAATSGHVWSANTHQRDPASSSWRYRSTSYNFLEWILATGLAATDVATGGLPTEAKIVVRPNAYEPGRANITVINWAKQGSVTVDLTSVLTVGEQYAVRNVQDLFGAPVASGTFGGGSIVIPLAGVTPPVPVGMSSSQAPNTGIDFNVFVITRN